MTKHHGYSKKRSIWPAITAAIILFLLLALYTYHFYDSQEVLTSNSADNTQPSQPEKNINESISTTSQADGAGDTIMPKDAIIKVDFTSQAPSGVWDALHEDACEEASFLMVKHYLDKSPIGSKEETDREIKDMIAYEQDYGYGASVTLEQLNGIAKAKYGLNGTVKPAAAENIESDIAAGHPVIVPAAGKLLKNSNFKNGGPIYHMLVIKGYASSSFITNDPGTRKGEGYIYEKSLLLDAVHDWDANNILNGAKNYLVF